MTDFFQFEADFVESLRCIPLVVRMKLDTCGVKLKLDHWHQFTLEEREILVNKPCKTSSEAMEYANFLQDLVHSKTGNYAKNLEIDSHPLWQQKDNIPPQILEKAQEFDLKLNINQWNNLSDLQRFALIKLSRPSHENRNFLPALQEFNLV
ncbi:nitrate reductase associated protein [Cyanobacterium stanieri LEGE 03274]|uniref:Nitrate reductase associated protein n=1 Tax=Cyanobacterium stanieri LEGE 03274 TaxID=1828756 RepID=A0ABR9V2Z3_9CHRO|nr:nitrate reductase associated protein [Cyanobacterium stanieri]MBE9222202.1 nitrate reductase associated protein [Cyanobacterium stanieri LEGE 03274]